MSLRRGKELVAVILRENREDDRGRLQPVEIGRVSLLCRIQPLSTADITAYAAAGERGVMTMKKLVCSDFPGDDLSQVLDADGTIYNVSGEPLRHNGSRRTSHVVVTLKQAFVKRGVR